MTQNIAAGYEPLNMGGTLHIRRYQRIPDEALNAVLVGDAIGSHYIQ